MKFLIALPVIFVAIILLQVGNFTKTKFLIKISKLILVIAIIFLIVEYLIYIDFNIANINIL